MTQLDLQTLQWQCQRILGQIGYYWRVCLYYIQLGYSYIFQLPAFLKWSALVLLYCSIICIIASHVVAIWNCRGKWLLKPGSKLMYSYFCGSGQHQRKLIYKEAHRLLQDGKWFGLSGCSYKLGQFAHKSKILLFLLSFIYIPLAIYGALEMILRFIIGSIYLLTISLVHRLSLGILHLLSLVLIPIAKLIDNAKKKEQHCPSCYRSFNLPGYKCPKCHTLHKKLIPSNTGIVFSKCECGKMLPCSLLSGRSSLDSVCPECGYGLAASNAKEFSIQLIGGDSSGKTAYIAAFQHMYRTANEQNKHVKISGAPLETFRSLDKMYINGTPERSSETVIGHYTLVHNFSEKDMESLVIYDVPDEALLSGDYEKNPLNYGYSKGIVIIVDPLGTRTIRDAMKKKGMTGSSRGPERDQTEDIIITFIEKYSSISNRASNKVLDVPVAVVINKSDHPAVKQYISQSSILASFNSNPQNYQNDFTYARSQICRTFLFDIGLGNAINNLESVFSNVQYFSCSAMGHRSTENTPFMPESVIDPIAWIVHSDSNRIGNILYATEQIINEGKYQDPALFAILNDKYESAHQLIQAGKYSDAEVILRSLGDYRGASTILERLTDIRYERACKHLQQGHYAEAQDIFKEIASYKDSASLILEAKYRQAKDLAQSHNFNKAIQILETIEQYKDSTELIRKICYLSAVDFYNNGKYTEAVKIFNRLDGYLDSDKYLYSIICEQIKNGVKEHLLLGQIHYKVLTTSQNRFALLFAEEVAFKRSFDKHLDNSIWPNSELRKYLNGSFYGSLPQALKQSICPVTINTYLPGTQNPVETKDYIFVLNSADMNQFFISFSDRVPSEAHFPASWSWLRNAGQSSGTVATLEANGTVNSIGRDAATAGGVRPSFWIVFN